MRLIRLNCDGKKPTAERVGYPCFNGYDDGMIDVYVDGKDCGSFYYKDGDSITITK